MKSKKKLKLFELLTIVETKLVKIMHDYEKTKPCYWTISDYFKISAHTCRYSLYIPYIYLCICAYKFLPKKKRNFSLETSLDWRNSSDCMLTRTNLLHLSLKMLIEGVFENTTEKVLKVSNFSCEHNSS